MKRLRDFDRISGATGSSELYTGSATPAAESQRKLSRKRLNLKFSLRCFSMNRLFFALSSDGIRLNISSI